MITIHVHAPLLTEVGDVDLPLIETNVPRKNTILFRTYLWKDTSREVASVTPGGTEGMTARKSIVHILEIVDVEADRRDRKISRARGARPWASRTSPLPATTTPICPPLIAPLRSTIKAGPLSNVPLMNLETSTRKDEQRYNRTPCHPLILQIVVMGH